MTCCPSGEQRKVGLVQKAVVSLPMVQPCWCSWGDQLVGAAAPSAAWFHFWAHGDCHVHSECSAELKRGFSWPVLCTVSEAEFDQALLLCMHPEYRGSPWHPHAALAAAEQRQHQTKLWARSTALLALLWDAGRACRAARVRLCSRCGAEREARSGGSHCELCVECVRRSYFCWSSGWSHWIAHLWCNAYLPLPCKWFVTVIFRYL